MANRLAQETSPYLLEHAQNPVDWYPWSQEALARALRENKPILLSIGYSACHWCHVMARESFEDDETAAVMNRDFVPIKVDREERPDLDQVYMRAVQAMTGSGGWPMTLFLLPDGTPFFAGTYFPASERLGMPSFRRVLAAVADAFANRQQEIAQTADQVREFLKRPALPLAAGTLDPTLLDEAYMRLAREYDPANGGFGHAPKFPQPMLLEFLLRTHLRTGQPAALEMATDTLRAMAAGGMYDQLGGGFHRYSVDERWLVPHFEKMLYDNALLARAYLDAWQLTREPVFARVAQETLAFVQREMTAPDGGFYSSLDADTEGEEGRFYLWTPAELDAVLGPEQGAAVAGAFDVTTDGNFEGHSILHPVAPGAIDLLAAARDRLLLARDQRVRPHRDEKVIAGWNGLMLRAFAEAGRVLRRPDLVAVAETNAQFLLSRMRQANRMRRSYKDGRAPLAGYLEDQAAFADGLLSLYEATFDATWLDHLRGLLTEMLTAFWDDTAGAFFDTAKDAEQLIARPRDVTDNATPSGTSLAIELLFHLSELEQNTEFRRRAAFTLESLADTMTRYPTAFGHLLGCADMELNGAIEVALVGDIRSEPFKALERVVAEQYVPSLVLAGGAPAASSPVKLLNDRPLIDGRPAAYVCRAYSCDKPVTEPEALSGQLENAAKIVPSAAAGV